MLVLRVSPRSTFPPKNSSDEGMENWPKRNVEKKKRDPSMRYQVPFTGSLWMSPHPDGIGYAVIRDELRIFPPTHQRFQSSCALVLSQAGRPQDRRASASGCRSAVPPERSPSVPMS